MKYRNGLTFSAAILGTVAQPCVFLYFVLFDQTFSGDTPDLIAVASIGSLAIWSFARVGVQPTIRSDGRTLFIRNRFSRTKPRWSAWRWWRGTGRQLSA